MRYSESRAGRKRAAGADVLAGILWLLPFLNNSAQASVQPGENNLHMYGALVAEPCVIPPEDEAVQLDFGTITDKYLYLHTRTAGESFSIHLTECDLSLADTVTVTFEGPESAALPGLLAPDGGSAASGIAVGLETMDAKPVRLNKNSGKIVLQGKNNVIVLKGYVQSEPEAIRTQGIVRGPFTATATFRLNYE
ncbi:fimbrial protein [Enterobacter bugandensis]|uniref:fimbrial protein n=1 Tax=Enterobacter bugandensis TaxID=881260 RepID=UPI0021D23522|nr:fimbrial protein [Enterobacter bugandensis]MCU6172061.1 fimbrial protein [Enterobacter bugandensis]